MTSYRLSIGLHKFPEYGRFDANILSFPKRLPPHLSYTYTRALGAMSYGPPLDTTTERALQIYQEVVSEQNLAVRATELVGAVETLQARIGSLQEDVVSLLVVLHDSLHITATIRCHKAMRRTEVGCHPGCRLFKSL